MYKTLLAEVVAKKIEQYTQDYITLLESTPDEALWSTAGHIPNAIGTLARHLTGNLNHYFGAAVLHNGYIRARDQEFAERGVSKAQLIADLQAAAKVAREALSQLDEHALAQPYTSPEGTAYESLGYYVVHMAMHFAMHYGQADYAQFVVKQNARAIGDPRIDTRPAQPYMGIRMQTPMKGMFKQVGLLFKEMRAWLKKQHVEPSGPPFLRYHVIDMDGQMDIEVGYPVSAPLPNSGRVTAGVLPAGRYASLIYRGSGLAGNKALIEWARDNKIPWDRWDDPQGDGFRARLETYLTDPKVEPRKTHWDVEVAIKLADS